MLYSITYTYFVHNFNVFLVNDSQQYLVNIIEHIINVDLYLIIKLVKVNVWIPPYRMHSPRLSNVAPSLTRESSTHGRERGRICFDKYIGQRLFFVHDNAINICEQKKQFIERKGHQLRTFIGCWVVSFVICSDADVLTRNKKRNWSCQSTIGSWTWSQFHKVCSG